VGDETREEDIMFLLCVHCRYRAARKNKG